jgi:hypothetical protein
MIHLFIELEYSLQIRLFIDLGESRGTTRRVLLLQCTIFPMIAPCIFRNLWFSLIRINLFAKLKDNSKLHSISIKNSKKKTEFKRQRYLQ